jgi:hypothetical protein
MSMVQALASVGIDAGQPAGFIAPLPPLPLVPVFVPPEPLVPLFVPPEPLVPVPLPDLPAPVPAVVSSSSELSASSELHDALAPAAQATIINVIHKRLFM